MAVAAQSGLGARPEPPDADGLFAAQALAETAGFDPPERGAKLTSPRLEIPPSRHRHMLLLERIHAAKLIPLAAGLATVALFDHLAAAFGYMALAGASQGAATTVFGSMWAERYGYRYLGSIRAFAQSLMVLTTALAPYTLGVLIDAGVSVERLFAALFGYVALAVALAFPASRAR